MAAYSRPFAALGQADRCMALFDEPDRYRDLFAALEEPHVIAQGAGLSYVAAGFDSAAVAVSMRRFNRLLAADLPPDGETGWVEAEAGITLGKLFSFLTPRGYFLTVQPGHPQLTLGGLIAADVHGKNHYKEGVFSGLVEQLTLHHPDHGTMLLSRTERPNLFDLTCGGFGLTGAILSARIRVVRIPAHRVRVRNAPVSSLLDTCRYLREAAQDYDMLQSWNDLSRLGPGAGFVISGRYEQDGPAPEIPEPLPYTWLDPHDPQHYRPHLFRRTTMPIINAAYAFNETRRKSNRRKTLFDYIYPVARKSFYFDWYGPRGFIEHQVLIPTDAATSYFTDLLALLRRHDHAVPRASMKLFRGNPRLLTYNGSGYSFSMDLFDTPQSRRVLADIDRLDVHHGCRANIIKDSRLSADTVRAQYATYGAVRARLVAHDPKRRFVSLLSRRLEL